MSKITLDDLQRMKSLLDDSRRQEIKELLIEFLDKHDHKTAKKVREEGLPKVIYCSEKVYKVLKEALGQYVEVVKFSEAIMGENICIFSWIEQESISIQEQPLINYDIRVSYQGPWVFMENYSA